MKDYKYELGAMIKLLIRIEISKKRLSYEDRNQLFLREGAISQLDFLNKMLDMLGEIK